MKLSAVILAGGKSERMGRDKAGLLLGGQTFLDRIISQLDGIYDIYLSVGRSDPYADGTVTHIQDDYENFGPMAGIQKALSCCKNEVLFVTACDMPFMDSQFAFYLAGFMKEDVDAVVPVDKDGWKHVLSALYRKQIGPVIEAQMQNGEKRIINVLEKIRVRYVQVQDHGMERKLKNINHPEEYENLLRKDNSNGSLIHRV